MTIRERISAALRKEPVDRIPLTIYPEMVPPGEEMRPWHELGLGLCERAWITKSSTPNATTDCVEYEEQGIRYSRTTVKTPVGEVYATRRLGAAYGSSWYVDHYIKGPDDYRAVEFLVRDTIYESNYETYHSAVERVGENGYVVGKFWYCPLMEMRVDLLGTELFSMDMYDRPDLFFSLHEALRAKQREAYPILANSPAEVVIYCGNCSPEILGKRFEQYCLPCYDELGEQLHAKGKLLGCHLDANNRLWAEAVAASELDLIEAFTPAPDSDMSVAEARAAWPSKVLWINFPSSLHLASTERIRQAARKILAQAGTGDGFLVGITEDLPFDVWHGSMSVLAQEVAAWAAPPSA